MLNKKQIVFLAMQDPREQCLTQITGRQRPRVPDGFIRHAAPHTGAPALAVSPWPAPWPAPVELLAGI